MCGIVIAKGKQLTKDRRSCFYDIPVPIHATERWYMFVKTFNGHKSVYKVILFEYEVMATMSVLEGDYLFSDVFK